MQVNRPARLRSLSAVGLHLILANDSTIGTLEMEHHIVLCDNVCIVGTTVLEH